MCIRDRSCAARETMPRGCRTGATACAPASNGCSRYEVVTVAADDRVVLLRLGRALTLTKALRADNRAARALRRPLLIEAIVGCMRVAAGAGLCPAGGTQRHDPSPARTVAGMFRAARSCGVTKG